MPSIYSSARTELAKLLIYGLFRKIRVLAQDGISNTTLYKWRRKYGGMDISDGRRLKQLEDEDRCLKRVVADQALDIQMLKAVNAKKR